jgi:hypothetical protein
MRSIHRAGWSRARGVIALCRARLRATGGGRAARALGVLCAGGFAAAAIALRAADGADASLSGLTIACAHWLPWIAGAPLSLAAADDREGADRRDGIEALAASRGVSPAGLAAARVLAAMAEIAAAIGIPLVTLAALTAALAGRSAAVLARIGIAAGALIFAVIAGVTLGGAAAASARFGRARGRWLFAAIVLGPWILADLAGHGAWSIPGALGAALDFVLGARSGHA